MDKFEIIALFALIVFAIPVLYLLWFVGRIIAAAVSDRRHMDEMRREAEAFEAMAKAVKATPLHQAKAEAEALLAAGGGFTSAAPVDSMPIPGLSQGLREFFATHGEVTAEGGEVFISRKGIRRYEHDRSFIRLGQDGEHTHLAAKPDEDAVYVIADDVPKDKQVEDEFPSIHHYLLFVDRRQKEARDE